MKMSLSYPPTDTPCDIGSRRGIFGWETLDQVSIPYLFRNSKKYVSVRIVELRFLSKYPASYPEGTKNLTSQYATEHEAKLLNEINTVHCENEYGSQPFTTQEELVEFEEFEQFYSVIKNHYDMSGDRVDETLAKSPQGKDSAGDDHGWIQVNNTVIPYMARNGTKFLPLSILRYAAGLLADVVVQGQDMTETETQHLNDMCRDAGVTFEFSDMAKVLPLSLLVALSGKELKVKELPQSDPFDHTEFHPELENTTPKDGGSHDTPPGATQQEKSPPPYDAQHIAVHGNLQQYSPNTASSPCQSPPGRSPANNSAETGSLHIQQGAPQHWGMYNSEQRGAYIGTPHMRPNMHMQRSPSDYRSNTQHGAAPHPQDSYSNSHQGSGCGSYDGTQQMSPPNLYPAPVQQTQHAFSTSHQGSRHPFHPEQGSFHQWSAPQMYPFGIGCQRGSAPMVRFNGFPQGASAAAIREMHPTHAQWPAASTPRFRTRQMNDRISPFGVRPVPPGAAPGQYFDPSYPPVLSHMSIQTNFSQYYHQPRGPANTLPHSQMPNLNVVPQMSSPRTDRPTVDNHSVPPQQRSERDHANRSPGQQFGNQGSTGLVQQRPQLLSPGQYAHTNHINPNIFWPGMTSPPLSARMSNTLPLDAVVASIPVPAPVANFQWQPPSVQPRGEAQAPVSHVSQTKAKQPQKKPQPRASTAQGRQETQSRASQTGTDQPQSETLPCASKKKRQKRPPPPPPPETSSSPPDAATDNAPAPKRRRRASKKKSTSSAAPQEPCLSGEINKSLFPGMTPAIFPGMLTPEPELVATPPGDQVKITRNPGTPCTSSAAAPSTSPQLEIVDNRPLHDLPLLTLCQFECLQNIKQVSVADLSISCLSRGDAAYALLEGLVPLYLPESSMGKLQTAIEAIVGSPLLHASEDEEAALICYYKLPIKRLRSNSIIDIMLFVKLLPQLKSILCEENTVAGDNNIENVENNENTKNRENVDSDKDKSTGDGSTVRVCAKNAEETELKESASNRDDLDSVCTKNVKILNRCEIKTEPQDEENSENHNLRCEKDNEEQNSKENAGDPRECERSTKECERSTQECERSAQDQDQNECADNTEILSEDVKSREVDNNNEESSCAVLKDLSADQLSNQAPDNIVSKSVACALLAKLAKCTPGIKKEPASFQVPKKHVEKLRECENLPLPFDASHKSACHTRSAEMQTMEI